MCITFWCRECCNIYYIYFSAFISTDDSPYFFMLSRIINKGWYFFISIYSFNYRASRNMVFSKCRARVP